MCYWPCLQLFDIFPPKSLELHARYGSIETEATPVLRCGSRGHPLGWLLLFLNIAFANRVGYCSGMRTAVYIDGFNLYYGAVKGTPYKWLDLEKMVGSLLGKGHDLVRIKYFTAIVSARSRNDRSALNQQLYLRAVRSNPLIEVHLGHFMTHPVSSRPRKRDQMSIWPPIWWLMGFMTNMTVR